MPKTIHEGPSMLRIPIMSRVTPDMRDRLEDLARSSGRSLAGEIEHRLELSFIAEDAFKVARLISDPDAAAMIEKAASLWPGDAA